MFENLYEGEGDDTTARRWTLLGDCGGDALMEQHGPHRYIMDSKQHLIWMRVGVGFLQQTYGEPPAGCTLGILWCQGPHGGGKHPEIALGYSSESLSNEVSEYIDRLMKGLALLDQSVDWKNVPRSKIEA